MKKRTRYAIIASFLIICAGATLYAGGFFKPPRPVPIPYSEWPTMHFGEIMVLIAADSRYSNQGFAGAEKHEFRKTLMLFPGIKPGTVFTNRDQGYGPVIKDLKIIYLDENMNILKEDIMEKETGMSTAPAGTAFAIEGPID